MSEAAVGPTSVEVPTARVDVNGLRVDALVDRHLFDDLLVPRLEELARGAAPGRRDFVFLAAPPGTGKSTLAALLVEQARHLDIDAVGIDGFHHRQSYLDTHRLETPSGPVLLAEVKGAPETFAVDALARHLDVGRTRDLDWPVYDRIVHDVVPEAQQVRASLVVVEGNWLLLDEPGWADLTAYSVFNVFVDAPADLLRDRLTDRKVNGGLSRRDAEAFYERSDRLNVERVLTHTDRSKIDLLLHLTSDGTIQQGGAQ